MTTRQSTIATLTEKIWTDSHANDDAHGNGDDYNAYSDAFNAKVDALCNADHLSPTELRYVKRLEAKGGHYVRGFRFAIARALNDCVRDGLSTYRPAL